MEAKMIEAITTLAMPLIVFFILRLWYKLLFSGSYRRSDILAALGWTKHPDKDTMIKDGFEADLRVSAWENVKRHREYINGAQK
jgi:hypothetical protein